MPRRRTALPKLCLHKPSGRAVVHINRLPVYLGKFGSPEAAKAYGELIAKLSQGSDREAARPGVPAAQFTVGDLLMRYVAEEYPRFAEAEQWCQKGAIRILRQLFPETPVQDFGPLKLRLVRDEMIKGDPNAIGSDGKSRPRKPWSRGFINKQVARLQAIFRWGVSWELVPQTVADALATVRPLKKGETSAIDYRPRRAVPAKDIEAVRAELSDRQRDIFDLLLLTGARPGEVIGLRVGDLDRSGEVWRADLVKHKTANKEKSRTLFFNRDAQLILLRNMKADPSARFFRMRVDSFSAAVRTACEKAFGMPKELRNPKRSLPPRELADVKRRAKEWRQANVFTPHWLRHTVATALADEMGTEAAQRLLGHAGKAMTEHYSKAAEKLAMTAAKRLGSGG